MTDVQRAQGHVRRGAVPRRRKHGGQCGRKEDVRTWGRTLALEIPPCLCFILLQGLQFDVVVIGAHLLFLG